MKQLITNKYYDLVNTEFEQDGKLTSSTIIKVIKGHEVEKQRLLESYGRYYNSDNKNIGVPILSRSFTNATGQVDTTVLDNKINLDYWSKIINVKTGYMFGVPLQYRIGGDYSDTEKALRILGWKAEKNIVEGLKETFHSLSF